MSPRDLLTGQPLDCTEDRPRERADAARNRALVLDAAARLFAAGSGPVTMDRIARAAGIGRGTLYRRYPDVASIAAALVDSRERELQAAILGGPPPLGPGAPPADRLAALYRAVVELLDAHTPIYRVLFVGEIRYAAGAYGFWRLHVRTLLVAADAPDPDALVDVLLAPIAPETFHLQRQVLGLSCARIAAALDRLAHGVLA
ncbi:MAG TPA: helix-turn-helix domain-containing protein [Actinocatenispora sp.]